MRMVAEQLGHANPSMTAKVYAHVSPDSAAAAIGVLDDAVRSRTT
jgi:integrase